MTVANGGVVRSNRRTARIVGALFIIATVSSIVGGSLLLPIDQTNAVIDAARSESRIVTGTLFEIVLALSVVGIAAMLFPVLKKRNEGLAVAYVGARVLEAVVQLTGTLSALSLLAISKKHGNDASANLKPVGYLTTGLRDWTSIVGPKTLFGVSALILYGLLLGSDLVPRWLSAWGLTGGALIVISGVLEMYGLDLPVAAQVVTTAPIAINEMVLAVWLLVKGFGGTDAKAPSPASMRFVQAAGCSR